MNRSPIETTLSDALIDLLVLRGRFVADYSLHYEEGGEPIRIDPRGSGITPRGVLSAHIHGTEQDDRIDIIPNIETAGYKIDLSMTGRVGMVWLAIECDGHDWHERTRQQASYDRARDRALLRAGLSAVIRFTGSDIHRDSRQCAQEIVDTYNAILLKNAARARDIVQSVSAPEEHW